MRSISAIILFTGVVLFVSACSARIAPTLETTFGQEGNVPEISQSAPTPTLQPTIQEPNTSTLTATPAAPASTEAIADDRVTLIVQQATYCRSGPGTRYPAVSILHPGDDVTVLGRYYFARYFFISQDGNADSGCWVYDETSSASGDVYSLPIISIAAPPSPTITPTSTTAPADFVLGTPWFDKCEIDSANYFIPQFEIINIGSTHFQSIRAVLTNETTYETFVYEFDYFRGSENCGIDNDGEITQLDAGDSIDMVLRGNRMLKENPAVKPYSLKVTLYAKNKQQGISVTRELVFTP